MLFIINCIWSVNISPTKRQNKKDKNPARPPINPLVGDSVNILQAGEFSSADIKQENP